MYKECLPCTSKKCTVLLQILFPFRLMPKDISGVGFVDYETNTCMKANCEISHSKSTKPPPKMSLGISRNDQFLMIYWGEDLVIYSILAPLDRFRLIADPMRQLKVFSYWFKMYAFRRNYRFECRGGQNGLKRTMAYYLIVAIWCVILECSSIQQRCYYCSTFLLSAATRTYCLLDDLRFNLKRFQITQKDALDTAGPVDFK